MASSKIDRLNSHVSMDAAPTERFGHTARQADISVDAFPGSPVTSYNPHLSRSDQHRPTDLPLYARDDKKIVKAFGDISLEESVDSSYGSMPSTGSMPSENWEEELEKYHDMMPTYYKVGYIDCLILYAEEDRSGAEVFRQHLINDIHIKKHGPVIALLYDCPELTSLAGGKISHLAESVKRSTYILMYLTENFVKDKWMEFSSESCLMESIYNPLKQWCVVPVYTKRRNSNFVVPMGLNSLKGINYYNNDEFYRNGVARLIGDKVYVRVRANEEHKTQQKKWLEEFKREQAMRKHEQQKTACEEEKKTREIELYLQKIVQRMYSGNDEAGFHHSSSDSALSSGHGSLQSFQSNDLKEIANQPPAVAQYIEDIRCRFKRPHQGSFTAAELNLLQSDNHDCMLGSTVTGYNALPHQVRRSNSTASFVSGDMGMPSGPEDSYKFKLETDKGITEVPVPTVLWEKIKNFSNDKQQSFVWTYITESQQQQQKQLPVHRFGQQQQHQSYPSFPHQPSNQQYTTNLHSPCLQSGVNTVGSNQSVTPEQLSMGEPSVLNDQNNLPDSTLFHSIATQSSISASSRNGYSRRGDLHSQADVCNSGVLPTVVMSLEEDGASLCGSPSFHGDQMGQAPVRGKMETTESDQKTKIVNTKEKSKYQRKYVTINIYKSDNVQIGDSNMVMGQKGSVNISDTEEDDEEEEEEIEEGEELIEEKMKLTMPEKKENKHKFKLEESSPEESTILYPLVKKQQNESIGEASSVGNTTITALTTAETTSEGEVDTALSSAGSATFNAIAPMFKPKKIENAALFNSTHQEPEICDELPAGLEKMIKEKTQNKKATRLESTNVVGATNVARVPPMMKNIVQESSDSENDLSETKVKEVVPSDQTEVKSVISQSRYEDNFSNKKSEKVFNNNSEVSVCRNDETTVKKAFLSESVVDKNELNVPSACLNGKDNHKSRDGQNVWSTQMAFGMSSYNDPTRLFYRQKSTNRKTTNVVEIPVSEGPLAEGSIEGITD